MGGQGRKIVSSGQPSLVSTLCHEDFLLRSCCLEQQDLMRTLRKTCSLLSQNVPSHSFHGDPFCLPPSCPPAWEISSGFRYPLLPLCSHTRPSSSSPHSSGRFTFWKIPQPPLPFHLKPLVNPLVTSSLDPLAFNITSQISRVSGGRLGF